MVCDCTLTETARFERQLANDAKADARTSTRWPYAVGNVAGGAERRARLPVVQPAHGATIDVEPHDASGLLEEPFGNHPLAGPAKCHEVLL
jgi:hypothetical protein